MENYHQIHLGGIPVSNCAAPLALLNLGADKQALLGLRTVPVRGSSLDETSSTQQRETLQKGVRLHYINTPVKRLGSVADTE